MASTKEYLEYILDQLSGLEDISWRGMMGEYIIYYRGKVVGGIYDNRFLVKPVKSALAMMPEAEYELPYEGAKEMLMVDDLDNREFLRELIESMYKELPAPGKKKRRKEIMIMENKEKSTLTLEDLEKATGGVLDDVPPVDEHDYDEEVKEKIK